MRHRRHDPAPHSRSDSVSSDVPVGITPLICPTCGGAVPLGDGAAVACPYCRAQVELPPEYVRLRDAEVADRTQRAIAADVLRRVGRTPPRWQRACASVFTGWAVLAGAYPAVILAIIVVELFGAPWLMRLVHANVFDVLGGEPVEELFDVVVGVGLASALTWAGVYGSRKAVSVRALQAALSARPPARPGGPAECRSCGAPLHVRPEDEAVRCPYCGTESLVRIAWSWIRKVQKNVEAVGASLASVRPAVEKNARDFRRALWLYGVGLVLLGALLIGGTISDLTPQWASRLDSFPPGWRLHVEAKPRVAFFETFQRSAIGRSAIVTWFTAPKLVPVGRPIPLTMTPPACDQSGCTADVLVALRHGERLRITTDATAASLFARIDRHVASGFAHDEFEPRGHEMPLDARRPIAFTAGWDAWYRIDFRAPGARAGSSWPVSLSLP